MGRVYHGLSSFFFFLGRGGGRKQEYPWGGESSFAVGEVLFFVFVLGLFGGWWEHFGVGGVLLCFCIFVCGFLNKLLGGGRKVVLFDFFLTGGARAVWEMVVRVRLMSCFSVLWGGMVRFLATLLLGCSAVSNT